MRGSRRVAVWVLIAGASLALASYASRFAIDFNVYALMARMLFGWGRPIYGPESGLAWPMWYRYPPLFLFLFWPFSLPPLKVGAFLWALLQCAAAVWIVKAVAARAGRGRWPGNVAAVCIGLPYLIAEVRYGNAQLLVFTLVAAALLLIATRPRLASALLGLAISLKLWPFFFVPYLAAARKWVAAVTALVCAAVFTLLPAIYFGWPEYVRRLEAWFHQESHIVADATAIWFPSQSLLGLMSRYFTDVPYERLPDPNYPEINLLALDPAHVYAAWVVVVALLYGLLLWWSARNMARAALGMHGLAVCALVLLEPYSQSEIALVVLVLPAVVAGCEWKRLPTWGRGLLYSAAGLAVLKQLFQHHHRWFGVLGLDSAVTLLLGGAMVALVRQSPVGPGASAPDRSTMPKALPAEKQDTSLMREMFHTISPRYDFITRVFSYGMDPSWKRRAVERAGLPRGACVLDLACGTGDFSKLVLTADATARPVSADLTFNMLRLAREDGLPRTVCADAMRLPFPDESFDAIFVGYGLRNFPCLDDALVEMRRVLKPRGKLVSLDFFLPRSAVFRTLYLGYLYVQGYIWGMLLHGRPRIYTYIPDSLSSFVSMDGYRERLERCGYSTLEQRGFILGGIALHWAARV